MPACVCSLANRCRRAAAANPAVETAARMKRNQREPKGQGQGQRPDSTSARIVSARRLRRLAGRSAPGAGCRWQTAMRTQRHHERCLDGKQMHPTGRIAQGLQPNNGRQAQSMGSSPGCHRPQRHGRPGIEGRPGGLTPGSHALWKESTAPCRHLWRTDQRCSAERSGCLRTGILRERSNSKWRGVTGCGELMWGWPVWHHHGRACLRSGTRTERARATCKFTACPVQPWQLACAGEAAGVPRRKQLPGRRQRGGNRETKCKGRDVCRRAQQPVCQCQQTTQPNAVCGILSFRQTGRRCPPTWSLLGLSLPRLLCLCPLVQPPSRAAPSLHPVSPLQAGGQPGSPDSAGW